MTSPTALSLKIRILGSFMVERLTHCHVFFNNKNRGMPTGRSLAHPAISRKGYMLADE
jgi:hypothetical protein